MQKLTFNAQLANSKKIIKSISGRLGNFIFRTYPNGAITAYYKPSKKHPLTGDYREQVEILSRQLRDIADQLRLTITHFTYNIQP